MAAAAKLEHTADAAHDHAAHAETSTGLDHRKLVMWVFIASETIFFAALMATFLIYKGKVSPEDGPEHLNIWVASANTFILLFSSLTMVLSLQAIESGKKRRMIFFLIATAFWGLVFLGGQAYEYSELIANGISYDSNLFASSFFALTGFHGTHVLIGVIWIISLIIRALRGGVNEHNHLAVEMGGLYWHFVDLVWVVLFTIIYLI